MVERADDLLAGDDAGRRRARITLDRAGSPAREARAFAVGALRSWGWTDVEVAELLVSELASNVVQHTPSRTVEVGVAERGVDRVRVEVVNEGIGDPTPQPPDPGRVGGHGLAVVGRLASGWGVRHEGDATTVWFDLDR